MIHPNRSTVPPGCSTSHRSTKTAPHTPPTPQKPRNAPHLEHLNTHPHRSKNPKPQVRPGTPWNVPPFLYRGRWRWNTTPPPHRTPPPGLRPLLGRPVFAHGRRLRRGSLFVSAWNGGSGQVSAETGCRLSGLRTRRHPSDLGEHPPDITLTAPAGPFAPVFRAGLTAGQVQGSSLGLRPGRTCAAQRLTGECAATPLPIGMSICSDRRVKWVYSGVYMAGWWMQGVQHVGV